MGENRERTGVLSAPKAAFAKGSSHTNLLLSSINSGDRISRLARHVFIQLLHPGRRYRALLTFCKYDPGFSLSIAVFD
jgi:hypothetical protein